MNGDCRCVAELGTARVAVSTDAPELITYLREFYPLSARPGPVDWSLQARLAEPEPGMALTPWRVGYRADAVTRRAVICTRNLRDLAVTTRKTVREVLLDYCEARGYVMLHASAVTDGARVILVVGDKGSGKTTLALHAALARGFRLLSNDHLILYQQTGELVLTSLPTPLPIKVGTYLDYEYLLGEPWDHEDVDIEDVRRLPHPQRYAQGRRLLYTYRGLGQPHPVHTRLAGRRVVVVLAGYAEDDEPAGMPEMVADPVRALWPHVRDDWVFDPTLNTHHLPRRDRDRTAYLRDARARLDELASTAEVVAWDHRGELAPLLDGDVR